LSTSNNGIDGSVLVDFLNVKVAPPIFPNSSAFSVVLTAVLPVGIDKPSPACNDRQQVGLTCEVVGKVRESTAADR
jgi:hypothetical protein